MAGEREENVSVVQIHAFMINFRIGNLESLDWNVSLLLRVSVKRRKFIAVLVWGNITPAKNTFRLVFSLSYLENHIWNS